ncbi:MAG: ethanolamine ammonia-lyase subunit EutC [Thalassovita sp.]
MSENKPSRQDPWAKLRDATPARIGLGRAGAGLPTDATLAFQFAHARARDAVHATIDWHALTQDLAPLPTIKVHSAAPDRVTYLRRPDLGRQLAAQGWPELTAGDPPDIQFVVADGLSADAVLNHAANVIHACIPGLKGLRIAPIVLAAQARVAIGDEIAERSGARLVIVLIGERPGLTVADSLGAYLTYAPRIGTRDSLRNCVSNIHMRGGLSCDQAAKKIIWLVREALSLRVTGTRLKENAVTTTIG